MLIAGCIFPVNGLFFEEGFLPRVCPLAEPKKCFFIFGFFAFLVYWVFFVEALDKIDNRIISMLLEDGRASFSTIAAEVQLTDVAIKKRVERLRRRGIISSITADLNLKALGYENPIFVQMRSELSKNKDVIKRLRELDYVTEIYQVLGEYNIFAQLVVPDLDSAEKFVERLGTMDGVLDIKTLVVISEVKKSKALPSFSLQNKL
ncbi:HTH-type transcriptional regulator Ptr1 [uncultured archaeon]|nr:HTH-type transcriptional regulator Ptr1 [uncultured archaeon]